MNESISPVTLESIRLPVAADMLEAIAETPKCPVLAHFGERDSMIPVEGVKGFAAAHPEIQVFIYAADHGFNCDQRGSYDAAAAALARERTLQHFRRQLG